MGGFQLWVAYRQKKTTPQGGSFVGAERDQARLESTALKVWLGHMIACSLALSGR
jgi:hypothetical protein